MQSSLPFQIFWKFNFDKNGAQDTSRNSKKVICGMCMCDFVGEPRKFNVYIYNFFFLWFYEKYLFFYYKLFLWNQIVL